MKENITSYDECLEEELKEEHETDIILESSDDDDFNVAEVTEEDEFCKTDDEGWL